MHVDLTRRPRTKRAFSEADMARMRDLYYDRRVPLQRVAGTFGVPVSTFLRWIAEMEWPRRSPSGPGHRPVYPFVVLPDGFRDTAGQEGIKRDGVARAATPTHSLPHGGGSGSSLPPEPPLAVRLAGEIAAAARRELAGLAGEEPRTLPERERRAETITKLCEAVERLARPRATHEAVLALKGDVDTLLARLAARREAPDPTTLAIHALETAIIGRLQRIVAR